MKYRMIDKRDRNAREELKEYTFSQLKAYFEPSEEEKIDFPDDYKKFLQVKDLYGLKEFLKEQADGMEQPFEFEEIDNEEEVVKMKKLMAEWESEKVKSHAAMFGATEESSQAFNAMWDFARKHGFVDGNGTIVIE